MNLIIYVNNHFDEERALFNLDTQEILLEGDYYHDKIDYQIKGYLLALGIDEEDIQEEYIDRKHKHYNLLEFYDDEYEYEESDED